MSNENLPAILNLQEIEVVANYMFTSKMFTDVHSAAQAVVKIIAGKELGLTPFVAMSGLNIISGKLTMTANLMASAVKSSGKYDYKILKHDEKICEIAFFENGKQNGEPVSFSMEDAKRAGLSGTNWTKYPKNMLFARAISNGVKWKCPDLFSGAAVYDPDELKDITSKNHVVECLAPQVTPHVVANINEEGKLRFTAKINDIKRMADTNDKLIMLSNMQLHIDEYNLDEKTHETYFNRLLELIDEVKEKLNIVDDEIVFNEEKENVN